MREALPSARTIVVRVVAVPPSIDRQTEFCRDTGLTPLLSIFIGGLVSDSLKLFQRAAAGGNNRRSGHEPAIYGHARYA